MRQRRSKNDDRKLKTFPLLMAFLLIIGCYILISQYFEYRRVQNEIEKNQQKLQEQQELNLKLKDERSKAQSPEEVERKAREDLGLVKPGEIPVRTVPTKSSNEKNNP